MAWTLNPDPTKDERRPPISGVPANIAKQAIDGMDLPEAIKSYIAAQIDYYASKHGEDALVSVCGYGGQVGSTVEVRYVGDQVGALDNPVDQSDVQITNWAHDDPNKPKDRAKA